MTDTLQQPTRPQPAATFVVFDRRTGAVLHHHMVSAAPGAEIPDEDQLARFVLDHAVHATRRHASEVDCLKVAADALKPKCTYRVDVSEGKLIETAATGHPYPER
jgi:hypothetical protein